MRKAVKTHLPAVSAPIEWATISDGVLYTAQIPIREDGSIETGATGVQAELTLDNLRRTVEAAGGTMDDVTQVLVFLPDPKDFAEMNAAFASAFKKPYPNRATMIAGLMVPGARIEIVAYANVGRRPARIEARAAAQPKVGAGRTAKVKSKNAARRSR